MSPCARRKPRRSGARLGVAGRRPRHRQRRSGGVSPMKKARTKAGLVGQRVVERAYQAGCIVVAAANNLPQPSFPSVFSSSLISVSKSEEKNPYHFGFRFGEIIELTAPGVNVHTTWLNGGYRSLTGNSFACPHIVGIIALLLENYPNLTPFQVKSALYAIARKNQAENDEEV